MKHYLIIYSVQLIWWSVLKFLLKIYLQNLISATRVVLSHIFVHNVFPKTASSSSDLKSFSFLLILVHDVVNHFYLEHLTAEEHACGNVYYLSFSFMLID